MANTQEKLGSGVSDLLTKQIAAREKLFSTEGKTQEQHLSIHSNTAWVKLRSSVNQITQDDADKLKVSIETRKEVTGDSTYAKSFILIAGSVSENGSRAGISRDPNVINVQSAYSNYERSLGFRPMPGITSFKAASKNTYGTLMQAEVSFTVWTVEDLEICELLYFRPGYTALLEWGHSVYVDNEGNIKQTGQESQTFSDSKWFESHTAEYIEKGLEKRKEQAFGNYDAMFGYVTNFSWSFRADGGYDCTVKIVSRGSVLESLKMGKTTTKIPKDEIGPGDKEKGKRERKSLYHYIFSRLEQKNSGEVFDGIKQLKDSKATYASTQLEPFKVWRTRQDFKRDSGMLSMIGIEKTANLQYITLRTVLDIFNKLCTLVDTTKPDKPKIVEFNTDSGQKYFTFPEHYSTDPVIALIPRTPTLEGVAVTKGNIHKNAETELKKEENGGTDDILNILVSTRFVEAEINAVLDSTQEDGIGYFDIIKGILSKIQGALGEVNDFDIAWDGYKHIVVDRTTLGPEKLNTVNITGLSNTVTELNISSKISSQISSQISIAAQGNSGNYADNISAILEWNSGALDRHLVVKDNDEAESDVEVDDKFDKFIEDLKDAYGSFNGTSWNTVYDGELYSQIKGDNIALLQKLSKEYLNSKGQAARGVVPVELTLKMLGIGGFKVGTAFNISKGILPKKYNNFSFIITGMEHEIGTSNRWSTTLKTQFYSTRKLNKNAQGLQKTKASEKQDNAFRSSTTENNLTPLVETDPNAPTPNADRLRVALANLQYLEKGRELSNGGDITGETAQMGISVAKKIKEKVPNISVVFTGGNDKFHQTLPYNSRHKKGTGLDFVISPSTPPNISKVKEVLEGFAAGNKPNFRFIDEYANPTKAASGKHFHISWGPGTEGAKAVTEAVVKAEKGLIPKYTV